MAQKSKAEYSKPASQVALEEAQKDGFASGKVLSTAKEYKAPEDDGNARDFTGGADDTEKYVGVDPIYQNHANDTEAPGKGSGVEDKLLDSLDKGATEVPAKEDSDEPSLEDRVKALEDRGDDTSDQSGDGNGEQNGDGGNATPELQTGIPESAAKK